RKRAEGPERRRLSAHFPIVGRAGYRAGMGILVETDGRSRVVLPGHSNQSFVMRENADGSILLEPARVVTDAQHDYDSTPELRELLERATASKTVRRTRSRRTA
ncbi:MAG: hypothetical protein JWM22_3419, partial [Frankiales bacterium]|nr:hypothetical protein [Frankiales bacterium]